MKEVKLKRIYESAEPSDGYRVLADRLWPRGVSKEDAAIDLWAKEITPSDELRKWYHANPDSYDEFSQRYAKEILENPEKDEFLELVRTKKTVSLLTAAKDISRSHLPVLKKTIEK